MTIAKALKALARELKSAGIESFPMLALDTRAEGLAFAKAVREQDDPETRDVVLGRYVEGDDGGPPWAHTTVGGVEVIWPFRDAVGRLR